MGCLYLANPSHPQTSVFWINPLGFWTFLGGSNLYKIHLSRISSRNKQESKTKISANLIQHRRWEISTVKKNMSTIIIRLPTIRPSLRLQLLTLHLRGVISLKKKSVHCLRKGIEKHVSNVQNPCDLSLCCLVDKDLYHDLSWLITISIKLGGILFCKITT